MRRVAIAGVGMTPFGRHPERSLRDLAGEAVRASLADAGIAPERLQMACVGNAFGGIVTGQEAVRGQVALQDVVPRGIPIFNVENACASSASAFHLAWLSVAAGQCDIALAMGVEKLYHADREVSSRALRSAADMENRDYDGNFFMGLYAQRARDYSKQSGATPRHYAMVSAKNRAHGSLNPYAQFRKPVTVEEVLAAPLIVDPLTRLMCSPIGDGAAAAVLVGGAAARGLRRPVWVRASVVVGGGAGEPIGARAARLAYERAGIGPEDVDVIELHDGAAPGELQLYEELGLCRPGEGPGLLERGDTTLGGRIPVNPGGGLIARGHPVGATGVAQLVELVWQLRGEAGDRQVTGACVGLAENSGGYVAGDSAAGSAHILSR